MAAAVTEKTRLVFVANPNNPTGTWVRSRQVEKFLDRLPGDVIAVFDEAYIEYVTRKAFPDVLPFIREGRPVITLRTFSKAYGLAGLRIGYLFAPAPYVREMNKVRQPFNTNHLAQAAATAPPGRVPAAVGVVIPPAGQSSKLNTWCCRCSSLRWNTVEAPFAV